MTVCITFPRDLKNLSRTLGLDIIKDVNKLKEGVEQELHALQESQRQQSSECSSRCVKLSQFTEQECVGITSEFTRKFDKVTEVFTRLAEQVKTHIGHFDEQKDLAEQSVRRVEERLQSHAETIKSEVNESYAMIVDKLASEGKLIEEEIAAIRERLDERCLKIEVDAR